MNKDDSLLIYDQHVKSKKCGPGSCRKSTDQLKKIKEINVTLSGVRVQKMHVFLSVASRPVLSKRIKSNVIQGHLASSNVIECMQCKHIIENLSVRSRPLSIFF